MATITLPPPNAKYQFSILTSIFKQGLPDTDADTFDYVCFLNSSSLSHEATTF